MAEQSKPKTTTPKPPKKKVGRPLFDGRESHITQVYRKLYRAYGRDIKYQDVESLGLFEILTPRSFRMVFIPKYHQVANAVDSLAIKTRGYGAKHRASYFTQRTITDDGSITAKSAMALLGSQSNECAICRRYLFDSEAHKQLDHIKPLSKGGEHVLTNVQWLCRFCNISKGGKYDEA